MSLLRRFAAPPKRHPVSLKLENQEIDITYPYTPKHACLVLQSLQLNMMEEKPSATVLPGERASAFSLGSPAHSFQNIHQTQGTN